MSNTEAGWKEWNPQASLSCTSCGIRIDIGPVFDGCPACRDEFGPAPLEVLYDDTPMALGDLAKAVEYLRINRQPIAAGDLVTLGRPDSTPLTALPRIGADLWVKNETTNSTWSHKDRAHEVGVGAAKLLRAKGVVATSTGNHGAAVAAHAAKAGMASIVFCHPHASTTAMLMIRAYGGLVAQVPGNERDSLVCSLVDEGWFPATNMDPAISGRANPYGAEGYKSIAYETVLSLGRLPATVLIPSASGDTLYGVAKGFAEVAEVLGEQLPAIVAVQPDGADPLARSVAQGRPVRVENAHSIALSVADPSSGRHAVTALRRWNGQTAVVTDASIVDAVRTLSTEGLLAEPASAASLAGYWELQRTGRLKVAGPTVLLLTNAGVKWPRELAEIYPGAAMTNADQVRAAIERIEQQDAAR